LIEADGNNVGVVTLEHAMERALDSGLDLVEIEIAPGADPPVCKVLDLGKLKYENQKKKSEARKKQKTIDVKEIKMRPNIDVHDYDVKMRSIREMAHQEIGMHVLERVREDLGESAKVEQFPRMEGRLMVMVMAPK
jgi:translation initiation factor IF-3